MRSKARQHLIHPMFGGAFRVSNRADAGLPIASDELPGLRIQRVSRERRRPFPREPQGAACGVIFAPGLVWSMKLAALRRPKNRGIRRHNRFWRLTKSCA